MNFKGFIAWRYLWSKKSHSAINVVSIVSAIAVAVVAAAMVCVLSVMNGFNDLVTRMFSDFDPDLRIEVAEGKSFSVETAAIDSLKTLPYVEILSQTIEETALVEFDGRQIPALFKGVDTLFSSLTQIDSTIVDGKFMVYDGAFERTVMGQGLAAQLGINPHFLSGVHIYAPKRNVKVNMLRPQDSFTQVTCFIAGLFAVNQSKYDDNMMLVSLPLARDLFLYSETEVTALEIKLAADAPKSAQKSIQQLLGAEYKVLNRYEQQADFYKILKIEKFLTGLLLAFIMLIAAFNLIGSLSMLILEKKDDILTFHTLGATERDIRLTFLYEGWMISSLGAVAGIVAGTLVCYSQQVWGWLKLGHDNNYIIESYPVSIQPLDILYVFAVVLIIGFVAAWYPARNISFDDKTWKRI